MSSFVDSTTSRKELHHSIISPPITPKQLLESMFHRSSIDEDGWDYASTEGSFSSSSSSSCSSSPIITHMYLGTKQEKMSISHIMNSTTEAIPSYRKKQKPIQSLPSSTKGAFCMPAMVTGNENKYTCSMSYQQQRRRFSSISSITTTGTISSGRKRKQSSSSDCTTESEGNSAPTKDYNPMSTTSNNIPPAAAIVEKQVKEQPVTTTLLTPSNQIENNIDSLAMAEEVVEDPQISKKAKTNAAYMYDNLSADCDQSIIFLNKEEWIPKLDVFDRRPTVRISWKGSPLKIKSMPYFEKLHAGEVSIAATLRLTPEQYLKCKWALVLAAKDAYENNALFRKSEAQKVCCIDVNKTSVLWNAFGKLGWLGSKWPQ